MGEGGNDDADQRTDGPDSLSFEDAQFGTFTVGPSGWNFYTEARWNYTTVELCLYDVADEQYTQEDREAALDVARSLWADQSAWTDKIRQAAAEWATEDDWLPDDLQVTADEFARSLTATTVAIRPDGEFQVWHDDGAMDTDHAIRVTGTIADGVTKVEWVG